jgi:hypothetical protein
MSGTNSVVGERAEEEGNTKALGGGVGQHARRRHHLVVAKLLSDNAIYNENSLSKTRRTNPSVYD